MKETFMTLIDHFSMKWQVFKYNFKWPDYVWLLDGWIARSAMAIPFVGYLILFNDSVAVHLKFDSLAAENLSPFGLSPGARLKFIYMSLVLLGCANILYRWCRPRVMQIGINQNDYVESGLKNFTFLDYVNMHLEIKRSGIDAHTMHGKYDNSGWDAFEAETLDPESGVKENVKAAHWVEAKNKFESLLRSILIETYISRVIKRRGLLVVSVFIALVGYFLLAIPSVDLFLKVMRVILTSLYDHGT